jgi:ribonuclease BN (tRNA processing enzyme)
MILTVLGTCAGFAGRADGCSSYLITCGDKQYLVDLGPGSVATLQNHIGYRDLDGILISHLHADHVSDIYTLRFAIQTAQRKRSMKAPFPIYLPDSPGDTFEFIRSNTGDEFRMSIIHDHQRIELDGMSVEFLKTEHSITAYAMRFEYEGKSLAYTSDTACFDELAAFCSGADILLAEATLQDSDAELESLGHMTARRAGSLARSAGVEMLLLTHIWPDYDRKISRRECAESFDGAFRLAERDLILTI